jgi:hypothetical protein
MNRALGEHSDGEILLSGMRGHDEVQFLAREEQDHQVCIK